MTVMNLKENTNLKTNQRRKSKSLRLPFDIIKVQEVVNLCHQKQKESVIHLKMKLLKL